MGGVLIADFQTRDGEWMTSFKVRGVRYITCAGRLWSGVMERCSPTGRTQRLRATYIGCEASANFKDFQYFAGWCQLQVGYCVAGFQIDKDILGNGTPFYGEENCVFVPSQLNNFWSSHAAGRGDLPIGVVYRKDNGNFRAQIRSNGTVKCLGVHFSPESAHEAYKVAKEAEAARWLQRLLHKEYTVDERVLDYLRTWKFKPTEELTL